MTGGLFPSHIRTIDQALDFLPKWAEVFGGVLRDGLEIEEDVDADNEVLFADVGEFHIDFAHANMVLTVALSFDRELQADFYKFDLRKTNGTLLWREDNHEGHEDDHGGPHHLHIGPGESHRMPAPPVTLLEVAEKVVTTHISLI